MEKRYMPTAGKTCRLPDVTGMGSLTEASADDVRVLITLALADYDIGVEKIAETLGISLTRAAAGVEYWLNAGVICQTEGETKKTALVSDELILGSAADDAREIAERKLKDCLDSCAEILGKLLNPAEINLLVGVITNYGVSESYLITLLDFCVNRLGKCGVKYAVKVANTLNADGVTNDAALDAYIRRYELVHSNEGQVRRLFGMGERSFSKREEEIFGRWFHTYGYDMEIVGAAYDITVATAGRVTPAYTDKILTKWHETGLKTIAEIDAYLAAEKEARGAAKSAPKKQKSTQLETSSFNIDSFFESALERSYGQKDK